MSAAAQMNLSGVCNRSIADPYRFTTIKTGQDFYAHFRGFRTSVQDLASVLAVLLWWDYDGFNACQQQIADTVTRLCNPTNRSGDPVAYSKKQMSDAFRILRDNGYINVPRRVDWKNKSTKTCTFTQKFKDLVSNRRRKKTSHQDLHGHKSSDITGTINYSTSITPSNNYTCNNNRAFKKTKDKETSIPRGQSVQRISHKGKPRVLPRSQPHRVKRTMTKAQRGVIHWLAGCSLVASDVEAFQLSHVFLQHRDDDFIAQVLAAWNDCLPSERSFHVRQLVPHLRQLLSMSAPVSDSGLCESAAPETNDDKLFSFGDAFNEALFWGVDYDGPGKWFIEAFHDADDETQTEMLQELQAGKINLYER